MFFTQSVIYDTLFVAILVLGTFVSVTYTYNNFKLGLTQKIISILLVLLNFRILLLHLYLSKAILYFPHFLIVTNLVSRIAVPLLFLIVYYEVVRSQWRWYDIFHFVPVLFFVLIFKDIYFGTAAFKKQLLLDMFENGYDIVWSRGNWVNEDFVFFIRTAPLLIYIGLIVILLILGRYFKEINRTMRLFFIGVLAFMIINLSPIIVNSLDFHPNQIAFFLTISSFVSTLFILIYFFFIPDFLYTKYFSEQDNMFQNDDYLVEEVILEQDLKDIFEEIDGYLKRTKLFLDPDLNINQLEDGLKISDRKISMIIKMNTNLNFSQFINDMRINYLLETANEDLINHKTLNEIAFQFGFNSVNSFFGYFKQKLGCTPRTYFKKKFKS